MYNSSVPVKKSKRKVLCAVGLIGILGTTMFSNVSEAQAAVKNKKINSYVADFSLVKFSFSDFYLGFPMWKYTIAEKSAVTPKPTATVKPAATSKPVATAKVTATPQPTEEPVVTTTPEVVVETEQPIATTKAEQDATTMVEDWDKEHSGYATYTGSGYTGGCSLLDPIPSTMEITALNPTDYNSYGVKAALAGAYLEVEGSKGKTVVYVTDLYPEGADGALDLCPTSFGKIGEMAAGKIDIKWRVVKAPVKGNVSYRIKEGTSPYWGAIQVRDHKYPVLKMEFKQNGKWVSLVKTQWNHFEGRDMGTGSVEIRMTDMLGHVITDTLDPLPKNGASEAYIVPGAVQFPD